jgi:hypothetical protein
MINKQSFVFEYCLVLRKFKSLLVLYFSFDLIRLSLERISDSHAKRRESVIFFFGEWDNIVEDRDVIRYFSLSFFGELKLINQYITNQRFINSSLVLILIMFVEEGVKGVTTKSLSC